MPDFYKSEAFSYPVPDPYWDYCVTWHELQEIKRMLEKLIEDMVFCENSNEDFDRKIARVTERMRERLKDIADSNFVGRQPPDNTSAYIDSADELEPIQ